MGQRQISMVSNTGTYVDSAGGWGRPWEPTVTPTQSIRFSLTALRNGWSSKAPAIEGMSTFPVRAYAVM